MIRFLFILCVLTSSIFSQDSLYIKSLMKKLTSTEFYGRGYRFEGHIKAAEFIVHELKNLKLEPYLNSYYQPFKVRTMMNTVDPVFKIEHTEYHVGKDFIPYYTSGSCNIVNQPMIEVDDVFNTLKSNIENQIVLIKDSTINTHSNANVIDHIKELNRLNAKAIIVVTEDFTYGHYFNNKLPALRINYKTYQQINSKNISIIINNEVHENITNNVLGFIPGKTDSTIILMGHYDHLNAITKDVYFPGANDNASGVSILLELAKFLKNKTVIHNILFIFFSGEEAGLIGSRYFTENIDLNLMNINFFINFDMVGSGEHGIMVLGGTENLKEFNIFKDLSKDLDIKNIRHRKNSPISDHYFFLNKKINGFYIYALDGKQPYHHIDDKENTIQYDRMYEIRTLVLNYLKYHNIWE